ncbi:hypothetical protein ACFW0T_33375, partial [Streptomyces sp. NPDC058989]
MVTFAQAQERAERWVNGDVPAPQHREVRVREFDLGFVAWAEDREGGPATDGGRARLVIARDSGETTLWPGLPVGEVIRRYEEEYGASVDGGQGAAEPAPQRIDLEATSFLLTPPEWLQQAADAIGVPDRRGGGAEPAAPVPAPAVSPEQAPPAPPPVPSASDAWAEVSVNGADGGVAQTGADAVEAGPEPAAAGSVGSGVDATPWAAADTTGSDAGAQDRSVGLPETVFAPPLAGYDAEDDAPAAPRARPEAKTELLHGGSQLPRTQVAPALDLGDRAGPGGGPDGQARPAGGPGGAPLPPPMPPAPPAAAGLPNLPPPSGAPVADVPPPPGAGAPGASGPGTPPVPAPPVGGGVHAAATMLADGSSLPGNAAAGPPPPPPAPGRPGAGRGGAQDPARLAEAETGKADARPGGGPAASGPGAPGAPAGGYVPTQLVSQLDAADVDLSAVDGTDRPEGAGAGGAGSGATGAGGPGGGVHAAATMLADGASLQASLGGAGGPGVPPPPGPPGAPKPPGPPGRSGGSAAGQGPAGQGGQGGPPPPPPAPPVAGGTGGGGVHAAATM